MEAVPRAQKRTWRFTLDGSAELEGRLEALCRQVLLRSLRIMTSSRLEGLVLGGGYGRGHGGVLKTEKGDAPYNDLEFYVFVRGHPLLNQARYNFQFRRMGEALSPDAGLHVEFKIDSLEKLRRSAVSIFSYDLLSGNRILYGDDSLFLGCEHHLNSERIVSTEATRLLLNRCSGLLLVKELLLKTSLTAQDSDFIGRNLAKAKLALGDALLTAEGLYHWDCRERGRRLAGLGADFKSPLARAVLKHHAAGVVFKLHPFRAFNSLDEFRAEHRQVTDLALREWLSVENRRLKANFVTLRDYSLSSQIKCAESQWWHNLLSTIRTFGFGAAFKHTSPRYPRERLFNTLPLLLSPSEVATEPAMKRHLQKQLHTRADDWPGLVSAYKQIWGVYG
jgi:hypothetical protein